MMTEALGKIAGMAMAYAVSSLGLLLAYINYRRRTVGASTIFTPRSWAVLAGTLALVAIGTAVVFLAAGGGEPPAEPSLAETPGLEAAPTADTPAPIEPATGRSDVAALGVFLPGVIFVFAAGVTFALYRHFAAGLQEDP